jgi:hypothetical protein
VLYFLSKIVRVVKDIFDKTRYDKIMNTGYDEQSYANSISMAKSCPNSNMPLQHFNHNRVNGLALEREAIISKLGNLRL